MPVQVSIRTQALAAVAALACIALITGALLILRHIGPGPASHLPAHRTLALVTRMPPAVRDTVEPVLPWITSMPDLDEATPVAALVQIGGQQTWITFDAAGRANQTVLTEGETPLTEDDAYRPLSTTYTPGSVWMFIRAPDVQVELTDLISPTSPLAISMGTGSVQIAWRDNDRAMPNLAPSPDLSGNDSVLSVDAGNLRSLMIEAVTLLPSTSRLALYGLIREWSATLFGPEISAEYDLLPFTDGQASVALTHASGSLATTLMATVTGKPDEAIDRLHRAVRSVSGMPERYTRTFDESFTIDTMRQKDPSATSGSLVSGWTRNDTSIERGGLFSALRGSWLILSTNTNSVQNAIAAMRVPPETFSMLARGTLRPSRIASILQDTGIRSGFLDLLPDSDIVLWQLSRFGSIRMLEIRPGF